MSKPLLIQNGLVATLEGAHGDGVEADVLIADGRIQTIGRGLEASAATVIDATGRLVMPGFIDTHRHTWQTAFRGIASDWSLAQYGQGMHGTLKPCFAPEDIYIANLLGRVEALDGGVTTMLDWCHAITSPAMADAAAQGLIDAPGRSIFAYCGNIVPPSSDDSIEAELRRIRTTILPSDTGLVTMALGLRGPQYSSMTTTEADVRAARELGLWVSVHAGSAAWGRNRPIARMRDRGLLDDRTTVIHCNTLADDELAMMADCGCAASISPDAEVQMGFGWPATGRLLRVGIRPSLSIDDCAAVCGDMFRTMHTTLVVQRGLDNLEVDNPTDQKGLRLRARHVVEFATLEGAKACGLGDELGSLRPGKLADILLVRMDDPLVFPMNHPLGQLVSSGHPGLVDTVIVEGRVVKRGGRMVDVDLDRLRRLALESRTRVLERVNARLPAGEAVRIGGGWHPDVTAYAGSAMRPAD